MAFFWYHLLTSCFFTECFVCTPPSVLENTAADSTLSINKALKPPEDRQDKQEKRRLTTANTLRRTKATEATEVWLIGRRILPPDMWRCHLCHLISSQQTPTPDSCHANFHTAVGNTTATKCSTTAVITLMEKKLFHCHKLF